MLLLLGAGCKHEASLTSAPHPRIRIDSVEVPTEGQLVALHTRTRDDIWAGGMGGILLHSTDGGHSWKKHVIRNEEGNLDLQFRDIEAIDEHTVYALSAGPGRLSRIYRTDDGGTTWQKHHENVIESGFFDCFAFWDRSNGLLYGDSVEGELFVLRIDASDTWQRIPKEVLPQAQQGEAGFAASGSCVRTKGLANAWIATGGGTFPRVLSTQDRGESWHSSAPPLRAENKTSGLTSLTFWSDREGMAFGADVADREHHQRDRVAWTNDGGQSWKRRRDTTLRGPIHGSASSSDGSIVFAVGPGGLDVSTDQGWSWQNLSHDNLWSISFANDHLAFAVGAEGNMVRISIPDGFKLTRPPPL